MSSVKPSSKRKPLDPNWVPPPWNPAEQPSRDGNKQERPSRRQRQPAPAVKPRSTMQLRPAADPNSRRILAIAVPQGITGLVALFVSAVGLLIAMPDLPLAIFFILGVQLIGYLLTRNEAPTGMRMAWIVGAIETAVILPVVALQTIIAREPYVSSSMGSAGPVLVATLVVAFVLIGVAIYVAAVSWQHPEEAGLVFMPLALLTPAVIGARNDVLEGSAVRALAQASLLAAGATVIAWALPRKMRPFVPAVALGLQFIALWATGNGPSFARTSDEVVPFMYGILLVLVVVLVVCVSILSLFFRRMIIAAELMETGQEWDRRNVQIDLPSIS
jgi:hypothetical protein